MSSITTEEKYYYYEIQKRINNNKIKELKENIMMQPTQKNTKQK